MSDIGGAVFLSYASEDAEAAARLCAGLRAAGVEVWFDQSELRGGDAWDHHIRSQIRDCALFIPIISSHTQSRPEGYFRLEWDLADQRSHMIVRSKAFIIPVCVDRTPDGGAEVPEMFLKVQWTRLPDGMPTPAFCDRIVNLLRGVEPGRRPPKPHGPSAHAPQKKSLPRAVLVTAAVLVVLGLGWLGWRLLRGETEGAAPAAPAIPAVGAAPEKSIAVLPFVDMSEKRDQEYFSDGLSEELIDQLSHNPDLKVIARTSSFAFKGKNEDIRTIARTLGVANLLEGSVRKSGSALRITAQLIRAADGVDLWSESYERQMTDVFKVQQEIAESVIKGLQAKLLPAAQGANSVPKNMDAYAKYLRGQYFARRASDADAEQAVAILKEAIALEPDFAPAHAELGQAYLYIGTFGVGGGPTTLDNARAQVAEALRLDPTLRSARNIRASLDILDWHWADAQTETDELIRTGPSDSESVLRGAQLARAFGHADKSLDLYRRALTIDPLSVMCHIQLAMLLNAMGRQDEARAAAEGAIAINPSVTKAHLILAFIEFQAGHLDAAHKLLEAESGDYYKLEGRAIVAYAKKDLRASDAALATLIATNGDSAGVQIAQAYAFRGERDKAFEWLNNAIVQKDPGLVNIKTDPLFASLHSDPRFAAVLHRMQLPLN
jgi:TolB-like protein